MKKTIKFLSVLLSLCLLAAFMPAVSFAESESAYAVYNQAAQTLTFCVGTPRDGCIVRSNGDEIPGVYYTDFLQTQFEDCNVPWQSINYNVKTVLFLDEIAPVCTGWWFYGFENLEQIVGLDNLNTENVTNMYYMFTMCSSLSELDLSNFKTQEVQTMNGMFAGCNSLTVLDLSGFNTQNVWEMSSMFAGCTSLKTLNIANFNTGNVSTLEGMFSGSNALSSLVLGTDYRFTSINEDHGEIYTEYADLPEPSDIDPFTGKWIKVGGDGTKYTAEELMDAYTGGDMAGRWIWEGLSLAEDISGATVTVADQIYTGTALTPAVTVTLNGTELLKDTDYTVDYENNTGIGTATVTVTGINNYTGTVTQTFEITEYIPDLADAAVTVEDQIYTGKKIRPDVTVILDENTLIEGTDYYVTYENNIEVGTATVTVFGIGDYTGSKTVTFAITEPSSISRAEITVHAINGEGGTILPDVTVMMDDNTLVPDTDYTVDYTFDPETRRGTVTITGIGAFNDSITFSFEIPEEGEPTIEPTDPTPGRLSFLEIIRQLFQKLVEFFKKFC